MRATVIGALIFALVGGFLLLNSLFVVDEREQAIVVQLGNPVRTEREAGLRFKLPIVQNVVTMDRRLIGIELTSQEVLTQDQRRILVNSFARFRIVDPLEAYKAATTEIGVSNLLERIMTSTVREILARQPLDAIVSGERISLMSRIADQTNRQATSFGVEVVDVRLKRVDLPPQNSDAIFKRMRTEREQVAAEERALGRQEAITLKAKAERQVTEILASAERDAQKIRGEAEGKATKIFADAFGKDEDFFEFYRSMQAYKASLGKDDTTLVLSPDSEFLKLFVTSKDQ